MPGLNSPIPGLNSVARAAPSLSRVPGVSALVNPDVASPLDPPDDLLRTFKDFTEPLSRVVTGEKVSLPPERNHAVNN